MFSDYRELTDTDMTANRRYREVAHFIYSQTTFMFASFSELEAFLDWIDPEAALSIRSVAFIAHMLPEGAEQCSDLIKGHYFRGTGWDHVALFRRMPNLATLDLRFFPSVMLSFTTDPYHPGDTSLTRG